MEQYIVGAGQLDDAGYAFRFSEEPNTAPVLLTRERVVTAGREWMRTHAPQQWAAFCAARLMGTNRVLIVAEEDGKVNPWGIEEHR